METDRVSQTKRDLCTGCGSDRIYTGALRENNGWYQEADGDSCQKDEGVLFMKIALYDFCDTVVNFQTADEYVYFTQKYLDLKEFRHTFMDHEKIRELFIDDWKTNK